MLGFYDFNILCGHKSAIYIQFDLTDCHPDYLNYNK